MSARSPLAPLRPSSDEEVFTVAELDARLRSTLQALGRLVVEGEVGGCKGPNSAGHVYFQLKDERAEATVGCVMFRRDAQSFGGERLVNGARVRVRAVADVFAPRGALQLQVLRVAAAGEGNLLLRREELKKKLAAEGLFLPQRKRALPVDPRVIGVVTSAGGAALHDIVKVANGRGTVRVLLAHAAVQGDDAARQLCAALVQLGQVAEVDVIILGRGGGSAEDLAPFDDERLARAIAACPKPVVAAVGHEVDWSIACLVADVRAATPSQAAEIVVPDDAARRARIGDGVRRLASAVRARLHEDEAALARNVARLRAPERALAVLHQRLDDLRARAVGATRARLQVSARAHEQVARRLAERHPRTVLARARGALLPVEVRLRAAMARRLARGGAAIAEIAGRLHAISPVAVLARGYAIALLRDPDGRVRALRRADDAPLDSTIDVRLHEGTLVARVMARAREKNGA